jgi:hypothetical protein
LKGGELYWHPQFLESVLPLAEQAPSFNKFAFKDTMLMIYSIKNIRIKKTEGERFHLL